MFFLGFAGTIIPYILFTCVMVILTLGANAEVLKKLTVAQEPAKEIVLETSDTDNNSQLVIAESQTSFHWVNHIDLQLSDDLNLTKPSVIPPSPEIQIKPIFPPAFSHYTSSYCALYFGLSPPQLV